MPRISIARLFDDNQARLRLEWRAGRDGANKALDSELTRDSSRGLIGHLNFIHPNLIQVLGESELQHLDSMDTAACTAMLIELETGGTLRPTAAEVRARCLNPDGSPDLIGGTMPSQNLAAADPFRHILLPFLAPSGAPDP